MSAPFILFNLWKADSKENQPVVIMYNTSSYITQETEEEEDWKCEHDPWFLHPQNTAFAHIRVHLAPPGEDQHSCFQLGL